MLLLLLLLLLHLLEARSMSHIVCTQVLQHARVLVHYEWFGESEDCHLAGLVGLLQGEGEGREGGERREKKKRTHHIQIRNVSNNHKALTTLRRFPYCAAPHPPSHSLVSLQTANCKKKTDRAFNGNTWWGR